MVQHAVAVSRNGSTRPGCCATRPRGPSTSTATRARNLVAQIKAVAPQMTCNVIGRPISPRRRGVSDDFPLARMYGWQRACGSSAAPTRLPRHRPRRTRRRTERKRDGRGGVGVSSRGLSGAWNFRDVAETTGSSASCTGPVRSADSTRQGAGHQPVGHHRWMSPTCAHPWGGSGAARRGSGWRDRPSAPVPDLSQTGRARRDRVKQMMTMLRRMTTSSPPARSGWARVRPGSPGMAGATGGSPDRDPAGRG